MIWIFSSFQAVCAEFLGHKISSSLIPCSEENKIEADSKRASAKFEEIKKDFSSPPSQANKSRQRTPRFAPELDGLHCFETIVSH